MDVMACLQQRPTYTQLEDAAKTLAKGSWKKLSKSERQEHLAEAKEGLRTKFIQTQAYQDLVTHYWTQEKDFVHSFAMRRRQVGVVDCDYDDLVAMAHVVILEVLAGHWGYWDHTKGPFQNFFRRALFNRFLTRLSYAGMLKTSAKKRQSQMVEVSEHADGQTTQVSHKQVLSLSYDMGSGEEALSFEDILASSEHKAMEESAVVQDIFRRLPTEKEQKLLTFMLLGLPHTQKSKERGMPVQKEMAAALREAGVPVAELTEEPTVCDLLGLSVHGFRYHKRKLAKTVQQLCEAA